MTSDQDGTALAVEIESKTELPFRAEKVFKPNRTACVIPAKWKCRFRLFRELQAGARHITPNII